VPEAGCVSLADPRTAETFHFTRAAYDPATGAASLAYRFDDGPELVERIVFPRAPWPTDRTRQDAFLRALDLLHGIAGVSYYKAGLSPSLQLHERASGGLLRFLTELYVHGLSELGYRNGVDVAERVHFSGQHEEWGNSDQADPLVLPERALIAMGGGKDSLVALDMLRQVGAEVLPVCVGTSTLIRETVDIAGLPLLQIQRDLAPELKELNRAGAWNGHVPVTAINSAILVCAALLYGYSAVVFANERSADEATVWTEGGREVNHQYSKSSAFEQGFRGIIRQHIGAGIEYYSILRPFSELGILQRFSHLEAFHPVFSSCNRNFHLDGPRVSGRWCRDCPKCRFIALGLALFIPPDAVAAIQGGNLLDDPAQEDGFRALCGLGHDKPFECVGETGESRAALLVLAQRPAWRDCAVVSSLRKELGTVETPAMAELLRPSPRHFIPAQLCARLGLPPSSHERD